jgi:hypothetical protein
MATLKKKITTGKFQNDKLTAKQFLDKLILLRAKSSADNSQFFRDEDIQEMRHLKKNFQHTDLERALFNFHWKNHCH